MQSISTGTWYVHIYRSSFPEQILWHTTTEVSTVMMSMLKNTTSKKHECTECDLAKQDRAKFTTTCTVYGVRVCAFFVMHRSHL